MYMYEPKVLYVLFFFVLFFFAVVDLKVLKYSLYI